MIINGCYTTTRQACKWVLLFLFFPTFCAPYFSLLFFLKMPLFKSENTQNIPSIPTFHDTFALIFQNFEPYFIPTFLLEGT